MVCLSVVSFLFVFLSNVHHCVVACLRNVLVVCLFGGWSFVKFVCRAFACLCNCVRVHSLAWLRDGRVVVGLRVCVCFRLSV